MQFTKRELQRLLHTPLFWLSICGVSILLGLVGPFGTYENLPLPARLAYWASIATVTYLAGVSCVMLLSRLLPSRQAPGPLAYGLYGAVAGIPVALIVWLINLGVFTASHRIPLAELAGYTVAISAVISALFAVIFERIARTAPLDGTADTAAQAAPAPPPILKRLPHNLRGRLSHLSMQDHYVDVRTEHGGALVLMRLADAITETGGVEGLQIHRSHWVATDMVDAGVQVGGRLMLKMKDGTMLPVSRSHIGAVREAGFF